MVIPQPQQREATDRPLLPAEHNALKRLVTKLAAATGEPSKQIWQSMLELSGVKDGELIPAKLFNHLVTRLAGAPDVKPAKYADAGITTDDAKNNL